MYIQIYIMETTTDQLTSVKVDKTLFEAFKISAIKLKFSLNKLTNRAMYLFLTDDEFRRKLMNQNNIDLPK